MMNDATASSYEQFISKLKQLLREHAFKDYSLENEKVFEEQFQSLEHDQFKDVISDTFRFVLYEQFVSVLAYIDSFIHTHTIII
jgi:hypothetical protein